MVGSWEELAFSHSNLDKKAWAFLSDFMDLCCVELLDLTIVSLTKYHVDSLVHSGGCVHWCSVLSTLPTNLVASASVLGVVERWPALTIWRTSTNYAAVRMGKTGLNWTLYPLVAEARIGNHHFKIRGCPFKKKMRWFVFLSQRFFRLWNFHPQKVMEHVFECF